MPPWIEVRYGRRVGSHDKPSGVNRAAVCREDPEVSAGLFALRKWRVDSSLDLPFVNRCPGGRSRGIRLEAAFYGGCIGKRLYGM